MQTVDNSVVRRQAVIRNRPSALPVAAGQVRHELLAVAVQIRITELIGNLVARAGHAVRRIVVAVDRELIDLCRVARGIHRRRAVRGQRCGFRLFCAFRSRRFLCDGGIALRREDVVHRVVCIQTNAQVVVTRFENVGFVDMLVVNRQFLAIHRHRDGLGFTGLEDIRLAEADKLHGCLLNRVRAVEFGVRLLTVDLHDFLARDVARLRKLGYVLRKARPFDMFSWTGEVETVVLLSHKKADSYIHIDVEFGEGEGKIPVDSIAKRAEAYKPKEKVTYKMIKEYIEAKYGFKVHTAYIAEVKRNLGLPMYDAPNAVEELKQPRKHPTAEKVEAIKDALKHFEVI